MVSTALVMGGTASSSMELIGDKGARRHPRPDVSDSLDDSARHGGSDGRGEVLVMVDGRGQLMAGPPECGEKHGRKCAVPALAGCRQAGSCQMPGSRQRAGNLLCGQEVVAAPER